MRLIMNDITFNPMIIKLQTHTHMYTHTHTHMYMYIHKCYPMVWYFESVFYIARVDVTSLDVCSNHDLIVYTSTWTNILNL